MTTAHRPTFDPARGKEAQRGPAFHTRSLPAYTHLKTRQEGQGGPGEASRRDLRQQLLEAEAKHFKKGGQASEPSEEAQDERGVKRQIEATDAQSGEDSLEEKRRKVLEETRDIDADSSSSEESESSDEDSEEDETAELMRELEKIKKERVEQREREEAEKAAEEAEQREQDVAMGNPLLNQTHDFNVKRRWDDDVVFKNQARGTEDRNKEFVNDLLRSDFHKRFMSKYVR